MAPLFRHLLPLLLAWLFSSQVLAAWPLMSLSAEQLAKPVDVPASLLIEDPSANLTASEVLELIGAQGQRVEGTPRMGYSASAWWVAFQLQAPAASKLNLIIAHPFLDDLEVWLYERDQLVSPFYSGDHRPFLQRGEPYPRFMLSLPRLGAGPHTLLVRVQSGSAISLPMQLVGANGSNLMLANEWLQTGLLVGALLSLVLLYLIRFSTLREPQLVWFCLTLVGVALYNASLQGLVALLAPQWPWLPMQLANLANPMMLLGSCLFIAAALRLELGWLRHLRNGLFALVLLVSAWTIVSYGHYRAYQSLNVLILLTGILQLCMLLLALKQRRPYAPGYLMAWSAALLLLLWVPLGRIGLLPTLPGINYVHVYLPVITLLLFSAMLDKQLERIRQALLRSQTQAIHNLEQYQALFNSSSEGIFRCTLDGELLEANRSFATLLGLTALPDNLHIHALMEKAQWAALTANLREQQQGISQECQLRGLDGHTRWVYLSLHPQQNYIEGIVVDLSERHALEERLHYLANHDSLTGLLNRRELERLLQASLSQGSGQAFSHLLCLDLDQFKQVNDLCGHAAGDQLLRQLANHLQRQLPNDAVLARLGGDEFAILLHNVEDSAALAQAEQLRQCVEQFVFTWAGRPFRLQASIGLLQLSAAISDWQTALSWADSASQQAKHLGRNQVQQFNPDDGALLEHQRQLQWLTRLREAIDQDHFELFYQPVVALQGPAEGLRYEVLLRYRDPQSGEWISPGQFLGAAERYGLLGAIDRWVLLHLLQWLADNPLHLAQLAQVNINLTASALLSGDFHRLLTSELQRLGIPAHKLCIEVTEMVALGELGVSAQWIEYLRAQGLKVALDDFGSGFASYAYLRHLPLDILKIDGSFIQGIEHDPINQAMVGSMHQIARQLGLSTVAEFVENQATLDCVRGLGVDYAQGYCIARPQPLSQLADPLAGAEQLSLAFNPLGRS
jgi:diguanylate cyclase (GGDEF)-like protein/PAS domain S-box-containing protein